MQINRVKRYDLEISAVGSGMEHRVEVSIGRLLLQEFPTKNALKLRYNLELVPELL